MNLLTGVDRAGYQRRIRPDTGQFKNPAPILQGLPPCLL